MKKCISILLVIVLALSIFSGCGANEVTALSKDAVLEIVGSGVELKLDSEQMSKMKLEQIICSTISSSGESKIVKARGFSVNTILEENGVSLKDFGAANLIANDGYKMTATAEEYGESDIYILLEYEGEPLEYPRSCIPDRRTMFWVKDLCKIEFGESSTDETASVGVSKISFFAEGIKGMTAEKIDNRGNKVESYSLKGYFEKEFSKTQSTNLKLIANDGFEKSETADVFFKNYVSYAVDEKSAPLYFSDKISDGMRVKGLEFVVGDGVAVYFGKEISVKELFAAVGMKDAANYIFLASDGFETKVPLEALKFGKVFFDGEKNMLRASFEGYDFGDVKGGGKVKQLLTVKAA